MPASDKKQTKKQVEQEESDSEELCFICTEPVITYAVGECDHRTCHRCALRLRALYETKNCTYCKVSWRKHKRDREITCLAPRLNKRSSFSQKKPKNRLMTM